MGARGRPGEIELPGNTWKTQLASLVHSDVDQKIQVATYLVVTSATALELRLMDVKSGAKVGVRPGIFTCNTAGDDPRTQSYMRPSNNGQIKNTYKQKKTQI